MVRLPTSEELGVRLPNASIRVPDIPTNPIPGAAQRAGSVLVNAAAKMRQEQEQADRFRLQSSLLKFESDWNTHISQAKQNVTPEKIGTFWADLDKEYKKGAKDFFKGVPEHLKPEFDAKLVRLNTDLRADAEGFQKKTQSDLAGVALDEGESTLLLRQQNNPGAWKEVESEGEQLIRDNPYLSGIDKEDRINKWRRKRAAADVMALPPEERKKAAPKGAGRSLVDRIIGVESGGDPTAKNPRSSATGLGQFTSGTWLATVKRHAPELMQGRSKQDVLALRNDPNISRAMTQALLDDNAEALLAAGVPVTDGNLYLAHFAGSGGASKILRAIQTGQGGASAASILGADAAKANPFMSGMTAKDLADWASRKVGSGGGEAASADPRYAALNFDDWQKITKGADTEIVEQEKARKAEQIAAATAEKERLSLDIQTRPDMTEDDILSNTVIDNGDKASLLRSFRRKHKDDITAGVAINEYMTGEGDWNPYDANTKKKLSLIDDAITKAQPDMTPEQRAGVWKEMAERKKAIPQSAVTFLRQGIGSDNAQQMVDSLSLASEISTRAPQALLAYDGGKTIADQAEIFRHYVHDLGMEPDRAVETIRALRDPERERDIKTLSQKATEVSKKFTAVNVHKLFNQWFNTEHIGYDPRQTEAIVNDYREMFNLRFIETGDIEAATALANADMKKVYGLSGVSGTDTVMRYPPENFFPTIAGSHDYLGPLVLDDARKALKKPDLQQGDVFLWYNERTAGQARAFLQGNAPPPTYALYYWTNENGQRILNRAPMDFALSQEDLNKVRSGIGSESQQRREGNQQLREELEPLQDFFTGPVGAQ